LLASTHRALNVLEAYMNLNATSNGIQRLSIRRNCALAASEAGRTARIDLLGALHLASLQPMLVFSNRPI
jgi:hypothetical protein